MEIKAVSMKVQALVFVFALLAVPMPADAADGLTSNYATIRDWDESKDKFDFGRCGVCSWCGYNPPPGDFFTADRGEDSIIYVFESPGIIGMGAVPLASITESPASGYQDSV